MTRKNLTDITVILDRSGSMTTVRDDTIGGFNTFLKSQKEAPGDAYMSLVQFDTLYEPNYTGRPVKEALELNQDTYMPRGGTALLDAIGRTINATGGRLRNLKEEDRPEKVIMVIQTDGQENASAEFTREKIKSMIEHQREKYQWQFVFLGADQDAFASASAYGIQASHTLSYHNSTAGSHHMYGVVGQSVCNFRSMDVNSVKNAAFFTQEDQKKAEETH